MTKGKTCNNCGIAGHFSKVCRKAKDTPQKHMRNKVRYVYENSDSDDEFTFAIKASQQRHA